MAWLREGLLYEDPRAPGILLSWAFPSEGVASWDQPWPGTPSVLGDQSPGKPCSPQGSGCPSCRGERKLRPRGRGRAAREPVLGPARQYWRKTGHPCHQHTSVPGTRVWAGGMLRPEALSRVNHLSPCSTTSPLPPAPLLPPNLSTQPQLPPAATEGEHVPGKVDSQGWDLPLLLGASSPFPTGHWLTQDTSFWSPGASGQWTYRTVPLPQNVLWTGL